jgi:sulfur-oxidizing protein SoxY
MTIETRNGSAVGFSRRNLLKLTGALVLGEAACLTVVRSAAATPASMQAAIANVTRGAKLNLGKIRLDIPPLVENGNTVPCTVTVDSPMTQAEYVKAIHVFTEKNPQPNVVSVQLGPRGGRASVSTRIRLADTQTVVAIAELSDGSLWSHRVDVLITLGACLEDS